MLVETIPTHHRRHCRFARFGAVQLRQQERRRPARRLHARVFGVHQARGRPRPVSRRCRRQARQQLLRAGGRLAQELFPYEDPLGKRVYLVENKDFYTVVGVLQVPQRHGGHRRLAGRAGFHQRLLHSHLDAAAAGRRHGRHPPRQLVRGRVVELNQITLQIEGAPTKCATRPSWCGHARACPLKSNPPPGRAASATETADAAAQAARRRRDRARRAARAGPRQRLMFMVLMGMIAAISLVVGGIGIMNIMLSLLRAVRRARDGDGSGRVCPSHPLPRRG